MKKFCWDLSDASILVKFLQAYEHWFILYDVSSWKHWYFLIIIFCNYPLHSNAGLSHWVSKIGLKGGFSFIICQVSNGWQTTQQNNETMKEETNIYGKVMGKRGVK